MQAWFVHAIQPPTSVPKQAVPRGSNGYGQYRLVQTTHSSPGVPSVPADGKRRGIK